MGNYKFTTAQNGQSLDQIRHARARKAESFAMTSRDFFSGVLHFSSATCQRDGISPFFDRRVADETGCNTGAHELGWRKWNIRADSGADAHVLIDPEGQVFWVSSRFGTPSRIFSLGELARWIGYFLPIRRADA